MTRLVYSLIILLILATTAYTQNIAGGPVVILGALNKITAKLEMIEVGRDQMVKFGTLEITMRNCRSNPPEETPESVAFLEIVDNGHEGMPKKIFTGWMFASSPAISPLEHAVYDVWITDCKMVEAPLVSDKQ